MTGNSPVHALNIDVKGNVSLAEPCPASPLHITQNSVEVFCVFPQYQNQSDKVKLGVLNDLRKWIESEEKLLKPIRQKENKENAGELPATTKGTPVKEENSNSADEPQPVVCPKCKDTGWIDFAGLSGMDSFKCSCSKGQTTGRA